jgi:hypothetical protein
MVAGRGSCGGSRLGLRLGQERFDDLGRLRVLVAVGAGAASLVLLQGAQMVSRAFFDLASPF